MTRGEQESGLGQRSAHRPFPASTAASELLPGSWGKWHNFPLQPGDRGVRGGASAPSGEGLGGSEQASSPVHSPETGSCLTRADSNKAWKGPGPREQAFQMNSTHRNRKQDTI